MEEPTSIRLRTLYTLTAAIALSIVAIAIWRETGGIPAAVPQFGNQTPNSALVMPPKGEPDLRFQSFSPWHALAIPTAVRLDWPTGTENGGLAYNAQPFWAMNEKRGGHHTGDDFNGIGGSNTDLGDPVFSIGDGLVVFAGESTPGWGNVVMVAHRNPEGKTLLSMYAHLDKVEVTNSSLIARGTKLGTIGTADGRYPAHLHFELRSGTVVETGGGYAKHQGDLLNPSEIITQHRGASLEGISPSPLAKALVP